MQRSQRNNAGFKSLSEHYEWPKNFGKKKDSLIKVKQEEENGRAFSEQEKQQREMESDRKNEIKENVDDQNTTQSKNSRRSRVSIEVKRIELEKEKRRQELENQKIEAENQIKLLELETEMKIAEIELCSKGSISGSKSDRQSALELSSFSSDFVEKWVALTAEQNPQCPKDIMNDNTEMYDDFSVKNGNAYITGGGAQVGNQSNEIKILNTAQQQNLEIQGKPDSDIKLLCDTIANALKTATTIPSTTSNPDHNLTTRQTLLKDFPPFYGHPDEWPIFYKNFELIRKTCHYSEDEILIKFQHCLRGEAKETVSGMLLAGGKVDVIMNTLKMRFGRPEHIIESMIVKVKNLPIIKDSNFDQLVKFSNQVTNLVTTMTTLDFTGHLTNPQLLKDLYNKLPEYLKLKWGEKVAQSFGKADLLTFAQFLEQTAEAACYVSSPRQDFSRSFKKSERVFSASETKLRKCSYCEKNVNHGKEYCSEMLTDDISLRWDKVKQKKLCFRCLHQNHRKSQCLQKQPCGIEGCRGRHHPLLHNDQKRSMNEIQNTDQTERNCTIKSKCGKVLLRMIPVCLEGPKGIMRILAMCDEGSTVSLLDKDIADKLGLVGKNEPLCLQWTNEITSSEEDSQKIDFSISSTNENGKRFTIKNVRTVRELALPSQTLTKEFLKEFSYLKDLPIESYCNERASLLIGQDNISLIVPLQTRFAAPNLPVASKSRLGWSLHGPTPTEQHLSVIHHATTFHICEKSQSEESEIARLLKESYSTESFGVTNVKAKLTGEEEKALKVMKDTIKYVGNRYEIGLLWKEDNVVLPNNKSMAELRLKCVERKCKKDPNIAKQYQEKIDSYLHKNYAKKLSKEEAKIENCKTWYLPHFPVENENKPGKIRLVYDAAAQFKGVSLNSNLLCGPDLLKSLVGTLFNFRIHQVAYAGDIREMFHQVRIRKEDRCSQRFMWRNLEPREPDVYEMDVMTFGATCSPVSAQYVKNKTAIEFAPNKIIEKAITDKFYVDDYLDSSPSEEVALEKIVEICRVLKLGGFELVNWITNSKTVTEKLSSGILATSKNMDNTNQHRVLGMWWDAEKDTFLFKYKKIDIINQQLTKRFFLKMVMSLFDPLGLVCCFTAKGRILMQEIWRTGIDWDTELPEKFKVEIQKWYNDLVKLEQIMFPRCYSNIIPDAEDIQLHLFCDSSEKAFACVSYLRIQKGKFIDVVLVTGKSRVSPLKPLSIPRLELQGALMASRLSKAILENLEVEINKVTFWTDSKCVWYWVRSDGRKFKPFIAHRIGEIQELTIESDWKWIPGELNVADEATRTDRKGIDSVISDRWIHGPSFLKQPEYKWPNISIDKLEIDDKMLEVKRDHLGETVMNITMMRTNVPDINRFSKWLRLIRSTAWSSRFENWMLAKKRKQKISFPPDLTVKEISDAEKIWIKISQQQSFRDDFNCLTNKKPLEKNSRLFSLNPIEKNGILVLSGRTNLSKTMTEDAKNPIILCPKHSYTKLLIQYYHEKFGHIGTETVLNELRQKFWILNGRAAVKSVFRNCQKCKNDKAKPKSPIMGQLPIPRVTSGLRAFTNTGMDFFGPINVTIGRRTEKRWGVLFTCMAVRAVHLELASSLNTDSAIMAIRRFVARRGYVENIYCDNGTNFKSANKELKKEIESLKKKSILEYGTTKNIQFHFNPPAAPHMGGAWERLIRTVKKAMGKILYCQHLREETLNTVLVETENIINARPLTKISTDPDDLEAITPNHFLMGWSNIDSLFQGDIGGKNLRREWRKCQTFVHAFWVRWSKEYLPTLNKNNKWNTDQRPLRVNDIVVIVDENTPRYHWKLGRIAAVYPGPDQRVRVVDVKTQDSLYRRPVSRICRLEVSDD